MNGDGAVNGLDVDPFVDAVRRKRPFTWRRRTIAALRLSSSEQEYILCGLDQSLGTNRITSRIGANVRSAEATSLSGTDSKHLKENFSGAREEDGGFCGCSFPRCASGDHARHASLRLRLLPKDPEIRRAGTPASVYTSTSHNPACHGRDTKNYRSGETYYAWQTSEAPAPERAGNGCSAAPKPPRPRPHRCCHLRSRWVKPGSHVTWFRRDVWQTAPPESPNTPPGHRLKEDTGAHRSMLCNSPRIQNPLVFQGRTPSWL